MQTKEPNRQPGDLVQVDGRWFEVSPSGGLTPYVKLERAIEISGLAASTLEKDSLRLQPRFPVVRFGRSRQWLVQGLMSAA